MSILKSTLKDGSIQIRFNHKNKKVVIIKKNLMLALQEVNKYKEVII